MEHIKYSITDLRALGVTGNLTVSTKGMKGANSMRLTDSGAYNMNGKGFCLMLMVSEAPTGNGIDWGGDLLSKVFVFSTYGNASYTSNVIFRWAGAGDDAGTIRAADDITEKKGVYVIYAKATSLLYKHNTVDLTKTISQAASGSANPAVLNFSAGSTVNNPTSTTQKMYATFNNDLTTDEVTQIQTIFEKYKDLL